MKNKGIIAIVAIIVLAIVGYFVFKPAPQPETTAAPEATAPAQPATTQEAAKVPDVITIATAGPITGDLAEFGAQMKSGAEKAVADINAAGGVMGKQLKLEVGDDQCDPKQAVAVANDLVSKGVVFVAGHFCSGSSIPASAVYHEEGILQITPASTNPKFTEDPAAAGWKTVFRTCGRDDQQGSFAGPWIAEHFKGKNAAIVDDKSAYGKGLADLTKAAMNAAGLTEACMNRSRRASRITPRWSAS